MSAKLKPRVVQKLLQELANKMLTVHVTTRRRCPSGYVFEALGDELYKSKSKAGVINAAIVYLRAAPRKTIVIRPVERKGKAAR